MFEARLQGVARDERNPCTRRRTHFQEAPLARREVGVRPVEGRRTRGDVEAEEPERGAAQEKRTRPASGPSGPTRTRRFLHRREARSARPPGEDSHEDRPQARHREERHLPQGGDLRTEQRRETGERRHERDPERTGDTGHVPGGARMVDVVDGEADERRAEDERQRVRTRTDGEERARRHEEGRPDGEQQLGHEAQRAEEEDAEEDHARDRHAREDVDLRLRPRGGARRMEQRAAAPDPHTVRRRRVTCLHAAAEVFGRVQRKAFRLQGDEQEVDAVPRADGIAVPQRPARREIRLERQHVVRREQERVVLHREERRHRAEETRRRSRRDLPVPARAQETARLRRKEARRPSRERAQGRPQVERRTRGKVRRKGVRRRAHRGRAGPLEEETPLAGPARRDVAQGRQILRRDERRQVGFDPQPAARAPREHADGRGEQKAERDAQSPHRLSSISSLSPFLNATDTRSGKPAPGTAVTLFTNSFTSLISKIWTIEVTSFSRRCVVVRPFTVIA